MPTEPRRRVVAERTPFLVELEPDEPPVAVLHAGDLVEVTGRGPKYEGKWVIEGRPFERHGELLALRTSNAMGGGFAFAEDVGEAVEAPASAWLCAKMGGPPECAGRLRRVEQGGAVVAWDPCAVGPCRAAVARGRRVAATTIDGLYDLARAVVDGQEVVVARARWVRDPKWTGATAYVFRVRDGLERALAVPIDELDARNPPAIQRLGALTVEDGALRFRGARREVAVTNGAVLLEQKLDETYHLAPAK